MWSTSNRASILKPVELGGVAGEDRVPLVLVERLVQRLHRRPVLVRVVARVDEPTGSDHVEELAYVPRLGRRQVRGRGRRLEVPLHVSRRLLLYPRHLAPDALPVLVEAPQERGQPREAALGEDDAERREAVEHALADEADDVCL